MMSPIGPPDLPPAPFLAWLRTCQDVARAVAAGPGMVALVGREGAGKTYTLTAIASSMPGQRARIRTMGTPIAPGVAVDLLDDFGFEDVAKLDAEPGFGGVRVLALRPEVLAPLLRGHPATKVVDVHPLSYRDVRSMVLARGEFLGLRNDLFTSRAISTLNSMCGGNPKKLDELFMQALRNADTSRPSRISGRQIQQAERDLSANSLVERTGITRAGAGVGQQSASAIDRPRTSRGDGFRLLDIAVPVPEPAEGSAAPPIARTEAPSPALPDVPPAPPSEPTLAALDLQSSLRSEIVRVLDLPNEETAVDMAERRSAWVRLTEPLDPDVLARAEKASLHRLLIRRALGVAAGVAAAAAIAGALAVLPEALGKASRIAEAAAARAGHYFDAMDGFADRGASQGPPTVTTQFGHR